MVDAEGQWWEQDPLWRAERERCLGVGWWVRSDLVFQTWSIRVVGSNLKKIRLGGSELVNQTLWIRTGESDLVDQSWLIRPCGSELVDQILWIRAGGTDVVDQTWWLRPGWTVLCFNSRLLVPKTGSDRSGCKCHSESFLSWKIHPETTKKITEAGASWPPYPSPWQLKRTSPPFVSGALSSTA